MDKAESLQHSLDSRGYDGEIQCTNLKIGVMISVRSKKYYYSYDDDSQALKNVSLKINDGEMAAILGKNGQENQHYSCISMEFTNLMTVKF